MNENETRMLSISEILNSCTSVVLALYTIMNVPADIRSTAGKSYKHMNYSFKIHIDSNCVTTMAVVAFDANKVKSAKFSASAWIIVPMINMMDPNIQLHVQ